MEPYGGDRALGTPGACRMNLPRPQHLRLPLSLTAAAALVTSITAESLGFHSVALFAGLILLAAITFLPWTWK